ncbi:MAG: response regulator [Actinobacteria bacterium]|nr:response regulator [Actinomycetota bacterium]
MIRILLIEDNPGDARLVEKYLLESEAAEFIVEHVDRLGLGLQRIDSEGFDVVLTDLNLPDSVGLETFEAIHAHARELPVVILSGYEDEDAAFDAVRAGAQDYVVKGSLKPEYLARTIRYAIARHKQLLAGLIERSEESAHADRQPQPSPDPSVPLILIIEARAEDRELAERSVAGRGLRSIHAGTGVEGLERARAERPSLILLDLELPDMGGDDVLRQLKGDGATSAIPVVITSAFTSPRSTQELRDSGAAACISKPIDVQGLRETVDSLVH